MNSQSERRTNPYPWTWEIPVACVLAVLTLVVLGVQLGRSVANLLAGNAWVLARETVFTSLPGVVSGDAAAGLAGVAHPAAHVLMFTCVGALEVLILVGVVMVTKTALERWGPGRVRGMATRAQTEQLLGVSRLRAHAKVIRPDLYGRGVKGPR
jgi:hypothetical protein